MKKLIFIIIIILLSAIISSEYSQPLAHGDKGTIIFVPGLGLQAQDYSEVIHSLNNNGYTVIKYKPTYISSDEYAKMVTVWSKDIGKLAGDKKVIVIGHSVGGAVAAHFCATDKRCIAGVDMDGTPANYEKIPVPFLYLQAEAGVIVIRDAWLEECLWSRL
jgi:alpha-beta hydrolase superfamily lysophospholipase